jgi:hypothetical protein
MDGLVADWLDNGRTQRETVDHGWRCARYLQIEPYLPWWCDVGLDEEWYVQDVVI